MPAEDNRVLNGAAPDTQVLERWIDIGGIHGDCIRGRLREPVADSISALSREFESRGLVAYFERVGDGHSILYGGVTPLPNPRVWVNLALFLATIGTTLLVGALNRGGNPFGNPLDLLLGVPFSASIIFVLGSHELAHYLVARRLGVDATLPYFLPVPHPMTGTIGAFIRIRSPVPSRGALVRVGVAGLIVGFLAALPVSAIGLALSRPTPVADTPGIQLGSPFIFWLMSELIYSSLPEGHDLMLHPIAFAGWFGLFVTALNLLPVGQLDGGHVAYAVFGRRWNRLSWLVIAALAALGFFWLGWPFWAIMAVVLGLKHPPPLEDITSLSRFDRWLVAAAAVVMLL